MTKTELYALWTRYMHRADLSADLDAAYELVGDRIRERLFGETPDLDAILETSPRMFVHGGLLQLAELAQDDIQYQREAVLWDQAVTDYSFRKSIDDNASPAMSRPYYPTEETSNAS